MLRRVIVSIQANYIKPSKRIAFELYQEDKSFSLSNTLRMLKWFLKTVNVFIQMENIEEWSKWRLLMIKLEKLLNKTILLHAFLK